MKNKLYVVTGICYPYEYDEPAYEIGEPIVKRSLEEAKNVFVKILEGVAEEAQTNRYEYSTFFDNEGTSMVVKADEMFTDVYKIYEVEVDF